MEPARRVRLHWSEMDLWERKGFASAEDLRGDVCFACRMPAPGCERAHVVADCEGGAGDAANLHMLCPVCHQDSEVLSGDRYWTWFWERTGRDMLLSRAARCGLNPWSILRADPEQGFARMGVAYALAVIGKDMSIEALAPMAEAVAAALGLRLSGGAGRPRKGR